MVEPVERILTIPGPNRLDRVREMILSGRDAGAESLCRQILAEEDNADAWQLLGVVAHKSGDFETALSAVQEALRLCPQAVAAHCNLGECLLALGRNEEAEAALRRALEIDPASALAHNNLGNLLRLTGRIAEAQTCFRQAIALASDYAAPRANLASILLELDRPEEALLVLECPANVQSSLEIAVDKAVALYRLQRPLSALSALSSLAEIRHPAVQLNLGNVLRDLGDWPGALARYRQAVSLSPDLMVAHSNALFTRLFDPDEDGLGLLAEARGWENGAPGRIASVRPKRRIGGDGRIRVGYLSPDFRHHAMAFFLAPLLAEHDRSAVEIFC